MTDITLTREDTGTHSVVRVIDPGVHESAPYSRAVGILDRWVQAEREAADAFAAWLEGQTAQAAAEMRQLADELDLPPVWAEVPSFDREAALNALVRQHRPPGWVPERPAVLSGPAPDETLPGREATPQPMPALTPAVEGTYTQPIAVDAGPRNPIARRVDGWLERRDGRFRRWLAERFTPVKEEQ